MSTLFGSLVATTAAVHPALAAAVPAGQTPTPSDAGVPLLSQKATVGNLIPYVWGIEPTVGNVQLVNGGGQDMWIRFGGDGVGVNETFAWEPYITAPSALNGGRAHKYTRNDDLTGQGDAFLLRPGEYQIVPYAGSAAWASGTLGCDDNGANCVINPMGRGGGTGPNDQPSTLFEWTVPGVWDASAVDGYQLPMQVEVDGCGPPFSGSPADCSAGTDPIIDLRFTPSLCPNKITAPDGAYLGCASMCGCQNAAIAAGQETVAWCENMHDVSTIRDVPGAPGGYCGCPGNDCVAWLRNFFETDRAGLAYCDAVQTMTAVTPGGPRTIYCQAYDDISGTKSSGDGIIKVIFSDSGFEWAGGNAPRAI